MFVDQIGEFYENFYPRSRSSSSSTSSVPSLCSSSGDSICSESSGASSSPSSAPSPHRGRRAQTSTSHSRTPQAHRVPGTLGSHGPQTCLSPSHDNLFSGPRANARRACSTPVHHSSHLAAELCEGQGQPDCKQTDGRTDGPASAMSKHHPQRPASPDLDKVRRALTASAPDISPHSCCVATRPLQGPQGLPNNHTCQWGEVSVQTLPMLPALGGKSGSDMLSYRSDNSEWHEIFDLNIPEW